LKESKNYYIYGKEYIAFDFVLEGQSEYSGKKKPKLGKRALTFGTK